MTTTQTPRGPIFSGGACKDNYPNIELFHAGGGLVVKLQAPALKSYRAASKALGRPIPLTGSWRSCAYQIELHNSDPNRYADPNTSLHPRGLAIDVNTTDPDFDRIHTLLTRRGWKRARPTDEPWHHSYWLDA